MVTGLPRNDSCRHGSQTASRESRRHPPQTRREKRRGTAGGTPVRGAVNHRMHARRVRPRDPERSSSGQYLAWTKGAASQNGPRRRESRNHATHRALPQHAVRGTGRDAANLGTIETTIMAKGELITLNVNVRRRSAGSYRIDVSAFGNNWWRHERIDETVTVDFDGYLVVNGRCSWDDGGVIQNRETPVRRRTQCWTEVAVTVLENGELIGRDSVNMVVRRQTSGAAEKSGTPEPGTEETKTRNDKKWDGSLRSRSRSPFFCPPSFCPPLPNRYLTTVARGETKRPPSSWLRCGRPALQEKDCRPPSDAVR